MELSDTPVSPYVCSTIYMEIVLSVIDTFVWFGNGSLLAMSGADVSDGGGEDPPVVITMMSSKYLLKFANGGSVGAQCGAEKYCPVYSRVQESSPSPGYVAQLEQEGAPSNVQTPFVYTPPTITEALFMLIPPFRFTLLAAAPYKTPSL